MPVYNGASMVGRAIESVLSQTFDDFELIISDNASNDGTEKICRDFAKSDARIRYIRQPTNIGGMPNFEYVLAASSGEYFFWAAHDDWRDVNFAAEAIRTLAAVPAASGAMGTVRYFRLDGTEQRQHRPPYLLDGATALDRVISYLKNGVTDTLVYGVFRREVILRASPFVRCSCPEKLIIMRALISGKIMDSGGMEYSSQIVEKDMKAVADTIGIPKFSDEYEIELFWSMIGLLRSNFGAIELVRIAPLYVLKNNWHRFFARWLLRRIMGRPN